MRERIRPTSDHLLVRVHEAETDAEAPAVNQKKSRRGEVLAAGPGKSNSSYTGNLTPMTVKVGDVVLFRSCVVDDVDGDKTLILLEESDVLAVVEK